MLRLVFFSYLIVLSTTYSQLCKYKVRRIEEKFPNCINTKSNCKRRRLKFHSYVPLIEKDSENFRYKECDWFDDGDAVASVCCIIKNEPGCCKVAVTDRMKNFMQDERIEKKLIITASILLIFSLGVFLYLNFPRIYYKSQRLIEVSKETPQCQPEVETQLSISRMSAVTVPSSPS